MKLVNDSIAVKLPVQKGIEVDSLVQIKEPQLAPNDRFVIIGGYGLPDSAKIALPAPQPVRRKKNEKNLCGS